jgi:sulfatase maturation enzyme AslB (radical SAM superfamily)
MSEYQSSDFAKLRFALKNDLHFFNRHNSWIAYGRISGVIIFLDNHQYEILNDFIAGYNLTQICAKHCLSFDDIISTLKLIVKRIGEKQVATEKLSSVDSLLILITDACNMSCSYCYGRYGIKNTPLFMTKDTARKIVDFSKINNIKKIAFFGGEPLLNFSIIKEIVEYSKSMGMEMIYGLTTNGTLVSKEVANYFKKNDIKVSVSIDGTKENHDKTRRYKNNSKTYDDVIKGIEILKQRKVLDLLEITYSTKHSMNLKEIINITKSIWPRVTCTCVEGSVSAPFSDEIIKGDRLKEYYNNMLQLIINADIEKAFEYTSGVFELIDALFSTYKINREYICSGVMNRITICPDGKMYPCPETMKGCYCFGTVFDDFLPGQLNKIRKNVLKQLKKKDKIDNYWFSNLVDTCIVRINESESSATIDDASTISDCLEDLIYIVSQKYRSPTNRSSGFGFAPLRSAKPIR